MPLPVRELASVVCRVRDAAREIRDSYARSECNDVGLRAVAWLDQDCGKTPLVEYLSANWATRFGLVDVG